MSKTEKLYCRQEVPNALVDQSPGVVDYVVDKMHSDIGKALADKLCDGNVYRVAMEKPHVEVGDIALTAGSTVYRSSVSVTPIVLCQDCKYWVYQYNGCSRNPCAEPWFATDHCSYGERR